VIPTSRDIGLKKVTQLLNSFRALNNTNASKKFSIQLGSPLSKA
jgi:hypothetical protein